MHYARVLSLNGRVFVHVQIWTRAGVFVLTACARLLHLATVNQDRFNAYALFVSTTGGIASMGWQVQLSRACT